MKEEIKGAWKLMKTKTQPTRTYWKQKSGSPTNAYIKRTERPQVNVLMLHLKCLEK
jgi:hypothetical protein